MEDKIKNKQIPVKTIVKVSEILEEYESRYDAIFQAEREKNKDVPFGKKHFEYDSAEADIKYIVELRDGKRMTESNRNWFLEQLNDLKAIQEIELLMSIRYYTKSGKQDYSDQANRISARVDFRNPKSDSLRYSDATIEVQTTNQEQKAHELYSTIMNVLEDNKDRYDKTIKGKSARIQGFCLSVGLIISYILLVIIKMNASIIPVNVDMILGNKYIVIFGQWVVSLLLGNVLARWYIMSIYEPILPDTKYVGYNSGSGKSIYDDDIVEYKERCEVQFGRYWDAEKRRNKIEKIYKISKKIILLQVIISLALYLLWK